MPSTRSFVAEATTTHGYVVNEHSPGLGICFTRNFGPGRVADTPTKSKAGQPTDTGLSEKAKAGGSGASRVSRRFGWFATQTRLLFGISKCRTVGVRLMGIGRTGEAD